MRRKNSDNSVLLPLFFLFEASISDQDVTNDLKRSKEQKLSSIKTCDTE